MSFSRPVASLLILAPCLAVVGCGSHTGSPSVKFTEPHAAMTEPGGNNGGHEGGSGSEGSGGSGGHGGTAHGIVHGVMWSGLGENKHARLGSGAFARP